MILLVSPRLSLIHDIGLMYDVNKPESFHYATELQKQLPEDMKVLYIANKSDLLRGV